MVFSLVVGVLLTGNEPASAQTDEPARHNLLRRLEHQEQARRQRIEQFRLAGKQNLEENRFSAPTILYDILPTGEPLFFTTCNLTAAQNVGTHKLWTGGELQLNLEGSNLTIGLWDAGAVRATHQEFTRRVSQIDNVSFIYNAGSNHATHVSGTLIAAGLSPQARGMAKEARLWAYDWNGDVPEMAQAAAAGLLISNHSYGYSAWGMPQWMFGFYDQYAANWDEITYIFPYYLPVKAAGNDGGSGYNSADGGYDLLLGASNAKNALVVGAVYGDTYTGPESVRIAPFSSWGPTDDGRIKPDLVAPGVNLYSAGAAADNAYAYGSGTSMATPVVTGSLALLQEYYRRLYGSYMQAATLRALAIHTAREAGSAPGPDYIHGWGLLNVEEAARVMQASSSQASIIAEHRLAQEEELVFQLRAAGNMPLKVTIAWNDPAAIPDNWGVEDVRTPLLVNDLDLRVEGEGHEYLP